MSTVCSENLKALHSPELHGFTNDQGEKRQQYTLEGTTQQLYLHVASNLDPTTICEVGIIRIFTLKMPSYGNRG